MDGLGERPRLMELALDSTWLQEDLTYRPFGYTADTHREHNRRLQGPVDEVPPDIRIRVAGCEFNLGGTT